LPSRTVIASYILSPNIVSASHAARVVHRGLAMHKRR